MSDLKKVIADNLVELRKMKKYTQQDLANILQYSDKAISKWEKGESLPDIEVLYQICNLYEVSLDFLTHPGSYAEKKEFIKPKYERRNKILITLITSTVIWLSIILIYVNLIRRGTNLWPLFIWGIPINCIALFYFNLKWGRRVFNIPIQTVLVWSILSSIFITSIYDSNAFWQIFLVGIPLQVAIVLWSQIKH